MATTTSFNGPMKRRMQYLSGDVIVRAPEFRARFVRLVMSSESAVYLYESQISHTIESDELSFSFRASQPWRGAECMTTTDTQSHDTPSRGGGTAAEPSSMSRCKP